jgi:tRNA A-37 threonylcarbamoyl transferase component Bud32
MRLWADKIIAVRTDKTIYRDGGTVIKLFDRDHSKSEVLNEALNQTWGEEMGLHVPEVLEVMLIDGKWGIRSQYISGKTLQQRMEDNPAECGRLLEGFVDLQIKIQAKSCPQLCYLKDVVKRKINAANLDCTMRQKLCAKLDKLPAYLNVCHGDFEPSNVIIADDGTPYIVDWPHAAQGSASADVARTYLSFALEGDLQKAEQYLSLYCTKTGIERQSVEEWFPIVAAALSVQCRKAEREILLHWIHENEYKIRM